MNRFTHFWSRKDAFCLLALLPYLVFDSITAPVSAQSVIPPAAVVLEISGSSTPVVAVREEIATGGQIKLAPEARLTLLHYSSCTVVTIVGGTVSVSDSGVEADAAFVQSRKQGPCPRIHQLSAEGARTSSGALILRGTSSFLQLSPHLDAILAGTSALGVSSAEVLDSAHNVVISVWAVDDTSLRSSEPLAAGKLYVLRLHWKDEAQALDVSFRVSKQTDLGPSLLRLE